MSSRTPGELRSKYGDRDVEWLRENLRRVRPGWKRVEMERMIAEKEGPPEGVKLAREAYWLTTWGIAIAVVIGLAGLFAAWAFSRG